MMDKQSVLRKRDESRLVIKRLNEAKKPHEDGEDPEFNPGTFLYIRAYEGDSGVRPVTSGITYWLSPDIEIYKDGVLFDTINPLQPDENYTIRVTVRNDGDSDCNSCMVDIFISQPSVGFTSDQMPCLGLSNASVPAHSSADIDFPFVTTKEMCGHRCLFARVYSLINNDYPEDFVHFQTRLDRHIGQQNVNIVKQGETIDFNIVTGRIVGVKQFEIVLRKHKTAIKKNVILKKKFEFPTRKIVNVDGFKLQKIELPVIRKTARTPKKPVVQRRPKLIEVERISKYSWKQPLDEGTHQMKIQVPFLDLKEKEAVPFELTVKDPETGDIIGGITLVVVG